MATPTQAAYIGNNAFVKIWPTLASDGTFATGLTFSAQAYDASDDSTAGAAVTMTEVTASSFYTATIPEASINGIAIIYIVVTCASPVSKVQTANMTQATYTGE